MSKVENTRKATPSVTIGGVDVTSHLAPSLLSLTYTDEASGKADELRIKLADPDGLFMNSWMPDKGEEVEASITVKDWFAEGGDLLPCGSFEVDEVEAQGPPTTVTVKAVSTAVTSTQRREKKSKAHENSNLRALASQIASANGLALRYDADIIPFKRIDQREEADLQFLQRLADKYGLNLKITDRQLVLYSGKRFDAKSSVAAITNGEAWIGRWNFKTQNHEVYSSCEVKYWDAAKKEEISYTYNAPGEITAGQTLKINERVESKAEAEAIAKNRLRQKNKDETEGNITLAGHPVLVAGSSVLVSGFGKYDGKYFIEQATHTVSRNCGYTTQVRIRTDLPY